MSGLLERARQPIRRPFDQATASAVVALVEEMAVALELSATALRAYADGDECVEEYLAEHEEVPCGACSYCLAQHAIAAIKGAS